LTYILSGGGAH